MENQWTDGIYDLNDEGYAGTAYGVAVIVILAALGLAVLKRSGFRAMVAVGPRG